MIKLLPAFYVFACAIACGFQAFGATAAASCPAPQPLSNMSLTLDSEFEQTGTINPNQWRTYVGQHGTPSQELEVYVPGDVKVNHSEGLVLETDKQSYWEHQYTSGEIITQGLFTQTYGHFEMLAKMPQANGMWPAFWLLPEDGGWPPEIDVMEYIYAPFGKLPSTAPGGLGSNPQTTLHWAGASGQNDQLAQGSDGFPVYLVNSGWDTTPAPAGLSSSFKGYHIYSIDWRPGSLAFFIDNKAVFCVADTTATGQRVPSVPMYMLLNDAISAGTSTSPGWPGYIESTQSFPLYYDVAYVKAYQFKDVHPTAMPFDIVNVQLSNPNPAPASTDNIEATVHVGPNSLGSGGVYFSIYDFINPQQYQGVKSTLSNVSAWIPSLNEGGTYTVKIPFSVPSAPGVYGIAGGGYYSAGPTDGNGGRSLYIPQAQTFTVR